MYELFSKETNCKKSFSFNQNSLLFLHFRCLRQVPSAPIAFGAGFTMYHLVVLSQIPSSIFSETAKRVLLWLLTTSRWFSKGANTDAHFQIHVFEITLSAGETKRFLSIRVLIDKLNWLRPRGSTFLVFISWPLLCWCNCYRITSCYLFLLHVRIGEIFLVWRILDVF